MNTYPILKSLHIFLALVSIAGFFIRSAWLARGSALVRHRLTRTVPHVVDTLFLASGIALAWQLHINPLEQTWLAAKLAGLVAYILLAGLAYGRARKDQLQPVFFLAALVVFAWIISVARLKDPLGFLALIGG